MEFHKLYLFGIVELYESYGKPYRINSQIPAKQSYTYFIQYSYTAMCSNEVTTMKWQNPKVVFDSMAEFDGIAIQRFKSDFFSRYADKLKSGVGALARFSCQLELNELLSC